MRALAAFCSPFCSLSIMGIRKLQRLSRTGLCSGQNILAFERGRRVAPAWTGVVVTKASLASRCLSGAEMGNAENSIKINP